MVEARELLLTLPEGWHCPASSDPAMFAPGASVTTRVKGWLRRRVELEGETALLAFYLACEQLSSPRSQQRLWARRRVSLLQAGAQLAVISEECDGAARPCATLTLCYLGSSHVEALEAAERALVLGEACGFTAAVDRSQRFRLL